MSESSRIKPRRPLFGIRLWFLIIPILAIGIGLSYAAYRFGVDWEHGKVDTAFRLDASFMGKSLESGIQANQDVVLALRSFFESSKKVTSEGFTVFTRDLLARHQDIRALEWIPRITKSQRKLFEAEARRIVEPDFQITERAPDGKLVSAGEREEYFPVLYVTPLIGNQAALGYDIASDPTRLKALKQAAQSGKGVASGRINLVQEAKEGYGFLFFCPVYTVPMVPSAPALRQSQLRGFALGVFHIPELVSRAIPHYRETGIDLFLFDITEKESEADFLFGYCPDAAEKHEPPHLECIEAAMATEYSHKHEFDFGGRKWQVLLVATPEFLEGRLTYLPHTILAAGLLATLLSLFFVVNSARAGKELYEKNMALSREMAERLGAESREAFFKYTVFQMRDAAYWMNSGGRFVYVNDSACKMLGYSRDELLEMSVPDIDPKMPADKWSGHWHELKQAGHMTMEMLHRRKDGDVYPVELSLNYVEFEGEAFICAFARDITIRKQAEIALQEKDALLRNVSKMAKVGGWEFDVHTGEGMWTETVAEIHDMDPREETNKFIGLSFYQGEHRRRIENALNQAVEHGKPFDVELELVTRKGNIKWIRSMGWPVKEGDKIVKLRGSVQDITERKQAEDALRRSEKEYRRLVESMNDGLCTADADGVMTFVNRRICEMWGYSEEQIIGSRVADFLDKENAAEFNRQRAFRKKGSSNTYELTVTGKNGRKVPVLISPTPIFDESGKFQGSLAVVTDISDLKRARDDLQEKQRQLATLMSNLPGMAYHSINKETWPLDFVSDGCYELTGYSPSELTSPDGPQFGDLIHPDDREYVWDSVQQSMQAGQPFVIEYRIHDKQGKVRWVWEHGMRVGQDADGAAFLEGFVHDITKRKKAEQELKASQSLLKTIFEASPALISLSTVEDGRYLDANQAFFEATGYAKEEVLGRSCLELGLIAGPDDWDEPKEHLLNEGALRDYEVNFRMKNGETKGVLWNAVTIEVQGELCSANVMIDITDRIFAERAIKENEETLSKQLAEINHIYQTSPIGLAFLDTQLRFVRINQTLAEINGVSMEEHLGKTIREVLPDMAPSLEPFYEGVLQSGEPLTNLAIHGDSPADPGSEKDWLVNYYPIKTPEGLIMGVGAVVQDITELKQAERALAKLNEELEERVEQRTAALAAANRELESFAYSVSHDLRAPLRALDGFSQAILEDYQERLDDDGRDYLRRIRAASQRMGQLIDDILRLSRLSRAEMKPGEVDLSLVVSDIAGRLQKEEPARKAGVTVQPGIKAWGDENLLRVLMENLLGNAWKFTSTRPEASIEFGVIPQANEEEAKGRSEWVYFIKDNGVGFNPDYKDRIFQVFQRLHTEDEFPGTGIGLATVQRIINRHGGAVWAESKEGEGAIFYFTLRGSEA